MDTDIIVALIGFGSTILGGLVTGIVMWLIYHRKNGSEARKIDAETTQLYQEIADRAATKALKLEDRIIVLEKALEVKDEKIAEYEVRIAALEKALNIKDVRIDELEAANREKECKIVNLQSEVDELREKVRVLESRKK